MKPIVPKKYLKLFKETAKNRIVEILFKYPEKEFSLSDLAKEAGVAKPNMGTILKEFEEAGIITIEKLSKIWRIKGNQENWFYKNSKIVYNLNFIYKSGIVEFLADYFNNPKAIILFGSFRRGEDLSTSDIDIAIEYGGGEKEDYKIIGLRELSEFEKQIGRRIQIHIFKKENIENYLFNNISNGIVLFGFLEVKK